MPSGTSLTLERGLRVLQLLAGSPDAFSISELAAGLHTHRAGIYRLLGPLVDARLVDRVEDGRYALGVGVLELARHVRPRLQEVAEPELRRLAERLRATTALTVRDGDEAVLALTVEPGNVDVRIAYRRGLRHRLDQAASGLAILAGGAPLSGERPEVAEARRCGWARSTGEVLAGVSGVAAPVVERPGRDAEAAVSAVWVDPTRDEREAGELVARAAQAIASALR